MSEIPVASPWSVAQFRDALEALTQRWRQDADDDLKASTSSPQHVHGSAGALRICAHELESLIRTAVAKFAKATEAREQPDLWRCRTCGCLWRDNHDDTVSLASVKQTSCVECEMKGSAEACEPLCSRRSGRDPALRQICAECEEPEVCRAHAGCARKVLSTIEAEYELAAIKKRAICLRLEHLIGPDDLAKRSDTIAALKTFEIVAALQIENEQLRRAGRDPAAEARQAWQPIASGPENERVLVIFQRGSVGFGCRVRDENDHLIWTDDDDGTLIGPVGWLSLSSLPPLSAPPAALDAVPTTNEAQ